MRRILVLVAVLGLAAYPAMAAAPVEKGARSCHGAETESEEDCTNQTARGVDGGGAGGRVHDGESDGRFRRTTGAQGPCGCLFHG